MKVECRIKHLQEGTAVLKTRCANTVACANKNILHLKTTINEYRSLMDNENELNVLLNVNLNQSFAETNERAIQLENQHATACTRLVAVTQLAKDNENGMY